MRSTCSIPNSAGRWQTGSRSVVRGRAGIAVDGHGLTASLDKRVLLIEDDFRPAGMLSENALRITVERKSSCKSAKQGAGRKAGLALLGRGRAGRGANRSGSPRPVAAHGAGTRAVPRQPACGVPPAPPTTASGLRSGKYVHSLN